MSKSRSTPTATARTAGRQAGGDGARGRHAVDGRWQPERSSPERSRCVGAFGLFLPPWTGRCWACVGLGGKSKASGGYGVGTAYGEGMAMGGVGG